MGQERDTVNWGGVSEFIAMGGYGAFVWGSYGVTALCIGVEVWLLARGKANP